MFSSSEKTLDFVDKAYANNEKKIIKRQMIRNNSNSISQVSTFTL